MSGFLTLLNVEIRGTAECAERAHGLSSSCPVECSQRRGIYFSDNLACLSTSCHTWHRSLVTSSLYGVTNKGLEINVPAVLFLVAALCTAGKSNTKKGTFFAQKEQWPRTPSNFTSRTLNTNRYSYWELLIKCVFIRIVQFQHLLLSLVCKYSHASGGGGGGIMYNHLIKECHESEDNSAVGPDLRCE